MVDDTLEKMIRGNGQPGSNPTLPPPIPTRTPTSTMTAGNASSTSQSSPGTTHSNPSATQTSGFPPQGTFSSVVSPQSTNPSEGKFIDKMSALIDKVVGLQTKRDDESNAGEASVSNLASNRQLAWSMIQVLRLDTRYLGTIRSI